MTTLGLKRVLGLPAVTFIAIGFTIGGGVFIFTGIVFKIVGPALPIAYTFAVIPVFISMMPLAMLGSAIPTIGGNYRYPSRMVSPGLAFVGIWVYALASFFGQIPLYALGCAKYAQVFFPNLSPAVFAITVVTFFYIINLLGVKLAAQIQGLLVVILIAALLYYSASGIKVLNPGYFENILKKGEASLILGAALLTFTYVGANGIIELGGEIIHPGRVIPRGFFIAFAVITFIYISVAIATVGAAPAAELDGADEPLIYIIQRIGTNAGIIFFIFGGAILALTTTLNALFIVGTKSLLIIVQDKILPGVFGKVHRRYTTPYVLLTIIWVLSVIGILSGFSLETLAAYAALGGLIIFLPIQIACLRLPKLFPEQYQKSEFKLQGFFLWSCPIVGILMVVFFGIIILYKLQSPLKIGSFIAFIISGIIFYLSRIRYLQKQGIFIKDLIAKDKIWHA
ncbi:MAG: amino acid permease [Deltaproteobacteria bacterium]|nr:MAG: amino acid permease [Deltaproteobacteria bacterium]